MGETGVWLAAAALLVSVLSVLATVGGVALIRTCRLVVTAENLQRLESRVRSAEAILEGQTVEQARYRESIEGLLEQLEATGERVERTRRSNAQAAAKLKQKQDREGNGPAADLGPTHPNSDLLQLARQRGHQV